MAFVFGGIALGSGALYLGKKFFNGGVNKYYPQLAKDTTVLITGGNTGIGEETALQIAKLGATVILACRNKEKSLPTVERIKRETGNEEIKLMILDVSNLDSVRQFADQFKQQYKKLDILINNAGIMALPTKQVSKQGFELQFATNYLGHFLLTQLLLEQLKNAKQSRVINVSSFAHTFGEVNLDDLNYEKRKYKDWESYGQSKKAQILFAQEFTKRFKDINVKCLSLHPGCVNTDLFNHFITSNPFKVAINYIIAPFKWYVMKNVQQGAQTSLHCSLIDYDQLQNGKFYSDCKISKPILPKNHEEIAEKLWDLSVKLTKL